MESDSELVPSNHLHLSHSHVQGVTEVCVPHRGGWKCEIGSQFIQNSILFNSFPFSFKQFAAVG